MFACPFFRRASSTASLCGLLVASNAAWCARRAVARSSNLTISFYVAREGTAVKCQWLADQGSRLSQPQAASRQCCATAIEAKYTIAGQLFGVAMATKKKKKQKGRGKAKKAEQNQEVAKQMETPDKQMERLNIDDDTEVALLDEAFKLAAAEKEALEAAVAEQEERADKLAKNQSSGCYHGHVECRHR
eukprot:scaffold21168_cov141-Skeletonema_dohrnii-CCMP3373.AAC.7